MVRFIQYLLFLPALLIFQTEIKSEAFYIRLYDVEVELLSDGSFKVKETIDLTFTESRRGILRDIPIRYREDRNSGSDRAIRPQGQEVYEIIVEDIQVQGHPYEYYREGDFLRIRIGDPNKRLSGEQRYTISYRVWGALNEFSDWVEFSWNIVGHHWDAPIEKATFTIEGESAISFDMEDLVFATGRSGTRQQHAEVRVEGNRIVGETTRPLGRFEGVSIASRHPKGHFDAIHPPLEKFAQYFVVREHNYDAGIREGGYFRIAESFRLDFAKPLTTFSRIAGKTIEGSGDGTTIYPLPENIEIQSDESNLDYELKRSRNETHIQFSKADGSPFSGEIEIQLTYDLWGGMISGTDEDRVHLDPVGFFPAEPVEKLNLQLTAPFLGRSTTHSGSVPLTNFFNSDGNGSLVAQAIYPAYRIHQLSFSSGIERGFYNESAQPPGIYGKSFLVDGMNILVELDQRQGVQLNYNWEVKHPFPEPPSTYEPIFLRRYSHNPNEMVGRLEVPSWNLMDRRIAPVANFESDPGILDRSIWGSRRVYKPGDEVRDQMSYAGSAGVYYRGLYSSRDGRNTVEVPLLTKSSELIRDISIEVHPPEGIDRSDIYAELWINGREQIPLHLREGLFVNDNERLNLPPGSSLSLRITGVEGFAGNLPLGSSLYLLFRNNFPIWWLAFIVLVLYLLWNRFGRNKKKAVVVEYYPPQKITSAEAGLLWDDKLHRKDLISLIYYWAGRGYLEVEEYEENGKVSYKLRKKKDLPADARNFEKTFFSGLFFKDEVKLSELRSRFSKTMMRAYKELMSYSKQHDFYVPGSRGFGCALTGLGILSLLAGLGGIVIAFFTGHWSWGVAPLVAGFALVYFGGIMPKKGPFGFKKYQKLLGFREFVRTAEIDRIKALYRDNPGYFDATIAYAIVFGLGKQWAGKFDGLMTEPPDWYKGYDSARPFTTIYFTNALIQSMHRMNYDLSMPATPSGGGGASSWSGGGGSSFGGGFSSGGGFGGGGGSSW